MPPPNPPHWELLVLLGPSSPLSSYLNRLVHHMTVIQGVIYSDPYITMVTVFYFSITVKYPL
jgi:hypothetical protein